MGTSEGSPRYLHSQGENRLEFERRMDSRSKCTNTKHRLVGGVGIVVCPLFLEAWTQLFQLLSIWAQFYPCIYATECEMVSAFEVSLIRGEGIRTSAQSSLCLLSPREWYILLSANTFRMGGIISRHITHFPLHPHHLGRAHQAYLLRAQRDTARI